MVVVVVSSMVVLGIYSYISKTRKGGVTQRLRANIESLTQISFFIIGRDIRRAGSNPAGALGYGIGTPIPLAQATQDKVEILADLDGDGTITAGTDEQVTYEYIDDPGAPDGVKDQIRRQSGNQLVIENVKAFELCYQLASGGWDCNPASTALIRTVRMRMLAGTGRLDPTSGVEDTKEIQMNILLRNFR
jgi:hypothetical protein